MAGPQNAQWWIFREGNIVGPVSMDLVVRGLMAGKIPHDARVRSMAHADWVPILSIDDFQDATQKTTMFDQATVLDVVKQMPVASVPPPPLDDAEREARQWNSPEWMLLIGEKMSGPFSLVEIRRTMVTRSLDAAMVCKLRTFDWLSIDEALALEGEPPSSTKMVVAPSVRPDEPMWMVWRPDDEDQGPTSIEQLAKALGAGRLADDAVIIRFGTTDRTPLLDLLQQYQLAPHRPSPRDPTVVGARRLGSEPDRYRRELRLWVMVFAAALVIGTLTYLVAR